MTEPNEPNEPPTPLTRMRFSWQQGTGRPREADDHAPPPVGDVDDLDAAAAPDATVPGTPPEPDEGGIRSAGGSTSSGSPIDELAPAGVPAYWDDDVPEPSPADHAPRPGSATGRAGAGSYASTRTGVRSRRSELPGRTEPGVPPESDLDGEPPRSRPSTPARQSRRQRRQKDPRRPGRGRGTGTASAGQPVERGTRSRGSGTRGGFDVPAPGGRFSGGRGAHTAVKVTLILSSCLVAIGIVAYLAFSLGVTTMRANTYRLSDADIARYRLSAFPLQQAGRFAADYARICLTHESTPGASDQREAQLSRYVASGTDTQCGWNGEGTQSVDDASWTGESEPIDLKEYAGRARMMTVRVLTSAGSRVVTVPVYVADLASGDGMRVVGDIGEMPQPTLAQAPEADPPADADGALGDALTEGEFFQQFFAAWGDSNRPALQRFMTPDASSRAAGGLGGTVDEPRIREARVFLPKGADSSTGTYEWKTGMVTEAWVWVEWQSPGAGGDTVETRAYRLQLVKTTQASSPSQEWAVRDIRGGVPETRGS